MTVRIGQLLDGKYRVVRVLGKGGMGAVYEGENTLISRRVAIKVLHPDLMKKPDMITRFELEARAAGRIQNDHINEVLDLGTLLNGSRFMVLEFLEGETLKERIKRAGRLTPMQAVHVVRQVLVGLSAAHRASIIHRDLKPGNVFILWEKLGQRDFVKIIDFGVSKFLLRGESNELDITQANAVLGTPHYMAPEQLRHSCDVDIRADLYSVGVILYKAITGRVPYQAKSIQELIFALMESQPVPASRWVAGLDPVFSRIVEKGIERNVDKRFQSADEFLAELEQWRMDMASSELPYFTEDGLISTMHNVSLRRGSSSEVSVPPVHIVRGGGHALGNKEISEISAVSMATQDDSGAASSSSGASDAGASLSTSSSGAALPSAGPQNISEPVRGPSSGASRRRMKPWGIALGLVLLGGAGAGVWFLSRTDEASGKTLDGVHVAASSTAVTPAQDAGEPKTAASDSKEPSSEHASEEEDGVLSITDLPSAEDELDRTTKTSRGTGSTKRTNDGEKDSTATSSPPPKETSKSKSPQPPAPTSTRSDWGY